jgi:glycosyltransferase involved in cell wall biosynthesis
MHNLSAVRKVCFISSRSGFITQESNVITDWANGRLITELFKNSSHRFSLAIFSDPVLNGNYDHKIYPAKIYQLPFPMSYYSGLRNTRKIYSIFKKIEEENDILIIQLPIVSFLPLLSFKKPVIYHICANVRTAANNPFKYKGLSLLSARLFAEFMHTIHKHLFRKKRNKLIANGNELGTLYEQYDPKVVVSSSVYADEIMKPAALVRRTGDEFNILFIGRPSKEKGIDVLMSAFEKLQQKHQNVQLHMVGVEREELVRGLAAKPVSEGAMRKINFYGFVSWGDQFKSIVRKCHVLIMSSISEGTPRVIIEARALGCPVIATNIGGISTSITHGADGILIEAGSEQQITSAIEDLMSNEDFRYRLSGNGLHTAARFTVENFAQTFASALEGIK